MWENTLKLRRTNSMTPASLAKYSSCALLETSGIKFLKKNLPKFLRKLSSTVIWLLKQHPYKP